MRPFSLVYDDTGLEVLSEAGRLVSFAQRSFPEGVVENGIVRNPEVFITALSEALSAAKPIPIVARQIVVGLPESRVFTTIIDLPKVRPREVAGTLRYQAADFLPADPEQFVIDFQLVTARSPKARKALVVACPVSVVHPLATTLSQGGFTPVRFVPRSTGLAQLFLDRPHTPILIIDFEQEDALSLIIAKNGTARFSTTIPAREFDVSTVTSIERAISFYESQDGQQRKVQSALVLPHPRGGPLVSRLQRDLAIPVQVANVRLADSQEPPKRLRQFLSNLGLLRLHRLQLNLLPSDVLAAQRRLWLRRWLSRARLAQVALSAVILLTSVLGIAEQYRRLSALEASLARSPVPESASLAQFSALTTFLDSYGQLQMNRSQHTEDLRSLTAKLNPGVRLVSIEYTDTDQQLTVTGERDGRPQLAEYYRDLSQVFPGQITIPTQDWTEREQSLFHLTISRT